MRLLATDLDGTLLRSDRQVSDRTREALAAAEASGVLTVFVTGRPPRLLDDLAHVVGEHGIAICANGGLVYDVPTRTVLETRPFDADALDAVVRDLLAAIPGVQIAAEGPDGRQSHPFAGGQLAKLLARHPDHDGDEFRDLVVGVVAGRAELGVSENTGLAELTAPGVTKAAALAAFAQERGMDAGDVWAVGDMPNDLPMLAWAGRSFAVANAHRDVLAAVDEVVPSNDADGVAMILERLVRS